ncbi:hypothetical protein F8M41_000951 [Gigaspora margarita]|uniref:Uncharacterized protein n=1 Tax=Gigaspora margarita TaxID=4874 RepID=A0A8H3XGL7_GIGMA|nr:hypothetical protein F8M41_000951 [Gigaspora margarita]
MSNEDDFHDFLKAVDGKGLKSIDDNCDSPKVIRSLSYIHANQHYRINAFHLKAVTINAIKKLKKTFYIQAYNDEDEPLERINASHLTEDTINTIKKPNMTFYIQAYNDEGEPLESEATKVIRSLSQIRPNQHYRINEDSYLKKEATWSIIEDQTMEEETLLAIQNALIEKINGPTKIFSK